jgi:hypothetical protein
MRANGIDFSKWAEGYVYVPGSVDFVVHRVAHGITEDVRLAEHADASKRVAVREGYIYYEMSSPWLKQVELAIELAKEHNLDNIWWDAEEDQWQNTFGNRFANETAEALRYLRMEFPNAGLYCNRNIYYLLEHKIDPEWLAEIPLWLADPHHDKVIDYYIAGNDEPLWYDFREFKRPRGAWTYWQTSFLGDPDRYGIIGKKAVDENVFNGTRAELLKLRGKSVIVENVKRLADKVRGNWKGKRIQPR